MQFKDSFSPKKVIHDRGIGIECEIPIVNENGEAVSLSVIQEMFVHLGRNGFEVEEDGYSGLLTAAQRVNTKGGQDFEYCTDTITTDAGYSIVEVVLAPQRSLHAIQSDLSDLLSLLIAFFERRECLMLGYGIQPVSPPSRNLLLPKERYCFFEKFSANEIIPEEIGADASFLNITASNQCHVQIGLEESVDAVNMLNALSGLQIALHANSPIWKGSTDPACKANREMIWEHCFPDRMNQIGIPPAFDSLESYVKYLLNFKPLIVNRADAYFRILNKETFSEYLLGESPTMAEALSGKSIQVRPLARDMRELMSFCWFNARLVPAYGTVESRMCCQQPQNEMLTSAAVTLGLVENLEAAHRFSTRLPLSKWRTIRQEASQHALKATVEGESIADLLLAFLDIAREGLEKRNRQEEVFLAPLYERLKQQKAPADRAIEVFENQGMAAFLRYASLKIGSFEQPQQPALDAQLSAGEH